MSRLFDDSLSQGLYLDSALVTSMPLSILLSVNLDSLAPAFQALAYLGNSGAVTGGYNIQVGSDGTVYAQLQQDGGGASHATATGFVANRWYRIGASFASTTSRALFVDGAKTTNTTSRTAPTPDYTSLGYSKKSTDDLYISGELQDVAFYNVTLTDAEFAAHAAGESIHNIRPTELVAHWTFRDRRMVDTSGRYHLISRTEPSPILIPTPRFAFPRRRRPMLRLIMPPDVASGTSVALSGNAATGAVGNLGQAVSLAISGNAAAGAVGTLGTSSATEIAITGNAATGAVGSLGLAVSLALSGNAGTGAVGSLGLSVATAISGEVGTGAVGSLGLAASIALSGNQATGSEGTLGLLSAPALSGNAATGSVGTLGLAVATALSGETATGAVGSVGLSIATALSGEVGTGAVGNLGLATAIAISGNAGTGAVGTLSLTGAAAISGNAATGSVGSVGLAVAVDLSGNAGTGSEGSLSVTGGNLSVTWTDEDDWRNARAESGVIHRNFGDRVGTEIAMGTDLLPQGPVDWFGVGQEQCTNPLLGTHSVYDSTANKTFITWSGIRLRPFITYYDHALGAWGPVVQISTVALTDDSHGMPQLCQDASGYLHVFWGTHNNAAEYAISTNVRDISAWTVQTDVTGNWSYQQPHVISGDIWLFGREEPSLGTTYNLSVKSSVGVATGHSWNSLIALVSFSGKMVYPSDYLAIGPDVHIVWNTRQTPSGTVNNIYYAVYETDTGLLKNAAGTDMGTLPISEATANTNCRVFNSGSDEANAGALWLDSSNNPHIAFIHDNTTTVDMRHTRWTGSAWTTPAVIATENGLWGKPAVINPTDSTVDLYYRRPSDGAVRKATFNPSDDTGITLSTLLSVGDWTPNGTLTYIGPTIIRGAHANLQMLLSEYLAANYWREDLRVGAWGDSGWVQAPAWRQDGGVALPLNEDSGAGTLVDYSGHKQDATNTSLVMGATGPLGLTGAELASTREATIPHNGSQWLFGSIPCTVRFWGKNLSGLICGKGRPNTNTLRYLINLHASNYVELAVRSSASWKTAVSSSGLTYSGVHLYEIVWDGSGTTTFRVDGAAKGTSTGIAAADFTATSPTNAFDLGYAYNSSSAATKGYGSGILMGLVMLPRYQGSLSEHQAFYDTLTAGSFTSKWVEAA